MYLAPVEGARIQDEQRAIIEDNGTYHYGLIRKPAEHVFARSLASRAINLPPVNIPDLPENQGVEEWLQVEDQQQQGSCQGHARTSSEEVAHYRQTEGDIVQLNRQFAYITSQMIDGIRGDRGSTIEGGARAAQKYGSCLESLAPYSGRYVTQFSDACWQDALKRQLTDWAALANYDEVMRWLAWGIGGIVIGIGWNGYCEPNGQGNIENYRSGGGGHALALVDWDKSMADSGGRPYIKMPNSWGRRWGKNGWARINPRVIDYWCQNETVIGYSKLKLEDVKPKQYDWLKRSFFS